MPADAVRFLRAALVCLVLGATLGWLALIYKAEPVLPWLWRWMPAHREVLLFGWLVQGAFGVACWILPRYLDPTCRAPKTAPAAFVLLNTGILCASLGPLLPLGPSVYVLGKTLEVLGCGAFLLHAWPRVRPVRVGRCDQG